MIGNITVISLNLTTKESVRAYDLFRGETRERMRERKGGR